MKVAAIEYPLPEDLQNCTALSHNEVWDKVWDKLSNHYGVDVRIIKHHGNSNHDKKK